MNCSIQGLLWPTVHKLCPPDQTARNAHFGQHDCLVCNNTGVCITVVSCVFVYKARVGEGWHIADFLVFSLDVCHLQGSLSETIVQPTSLLGCNLDINILLRLPFACFSLHCNIHSPIKLGMKQWRELSWAITLNQQGPFSLVSRL